jgi:hypothetical protein
MPLTGMGFGRAELATAAGSPGRPNEDYAATGPGWALVLDGATHLGGVDTGCVHDVPWLVRHLAAALTGPLAASAASLAEILADAIEATCRAHAGRCDLANPDSPSSTVAMIRAAGNALDCLVLGDSPVLLEASGQITPVTDNRVDHLRPGGRPYSRELVRAKRNAPGGFWVASTDPGAAREAVCVSARGVTHAALLTDGVTRLVDRYGYDWPGVFAVLGRDGPAGLIERVRAAERTAPAGGGKPHDDATAVYVRLAPVPR